MRFELLYSGLANQQMDGLEGSAALKKRYKAVRKTLFLLQTNPRHPGLHTHKYSSMFGPNGEEVFEAYCENRTPGAYRLFWYYGPGKKEITILAITPHP